jgi:carboxypeptidase T
MIHRNVVRSLAAALVGVLIYGCGDNVPDVGPSNGYLLLTPLFAGVDSGTTQTLAATLNGDPVPVTWATTDASIASVSADGVVTGVKPGAASITATITSDATQQRSASITVLSVLGLPITSGVPVTGLSGPADDEKLYHITVPSGTTNLSVVLAGGTGDADLYVQRATPPSEDTFDCQSAGATTNETCDIPDPEPGTWYIWVLSFNYSGATLTATLTP